MDDKQLQGIVTVRNNGSTTTTMVDGSTTTTVNYLYLHDNNILIW